MTEALVPGPSDLQRGLEISGDTFGRHAPALARIPRLGRSDTPDDWLPWVLVDKGLEMIVPYVRDLPKALREGPAWLRIRGTDPAIEIGIGWVESAGVVDRADGIHPWHQFQVGFETPPESIDQAKQLVGIINLSKSSWDELFRLYSIDRDFRPLRMDMHRADEGSLFDGYSGDPRWDGGPIVSFGIVAGAIAALDVTVAGGGHAAAGTASDLFGPGYRMDLDMFEDRPLPIVAVHSRRRSGAALVEIDDVWPDRWPITDWRAGAAIAQPTAGDPS